jgi:hypothetical protein
LDRKATPHIQHHSSLIEYSEVFLAQFLIALLLEKSNLYCHQYYILQAASSLLRQCFKSEEIEGFNAPVLYRSQKKSYRCMMASI